MYLVPPLLLLSHCRVLVIDYSILKTVNAIANMINGSIRFIVRHRISFSVAV